MLLEILSYMPDILIMQEIDRFDWLEHKLKEFGYKGVFEARPFSPCTDIPGEDAKPDGCAIFYHTGRFIMNSHAHRPLVDKMNHSTSALALAVKLNFIEDNASLLVCSTHLKGGPKTESMRAEASIDFMHFVSDNTCDMIVLGCDLCESSTGDGYKHISDKFKDSYSVANLGKQPDYTTWRVRPLGEEKFVNDFTFYNANNLRVCQVLNVPDEKCIGERRLPNINSASDHVPLITDFQRILG